jgi:hypothetical protein
MRSGIYIMYCISILYPNPNPQGYQQLGRQPTFALQQQPIGPVGMAPLAGPLEPFHGVCYRCGEPGHKSFDGHRRHRSIASIAINLDIMMISVSHKIIPSAVTIRVGIEINNIVRRQRTNFIIGTPRLTLLIITLKQIGPNMACITIPSPIKAAHTKGTDLLVIQATSTAATPVIATSAIATPQKCM